MKKPDPTPLFDIDPYRDLGLESSATAEAIKQAYFNLVRLHPPERDPKAFKRIRAAYECLRTPEARLDTTMLRPMPWPEPPLEGLGGEAEEDWRAQILAAAKALSDVGRRNFHEDFREIKL